MCKSGSGNAWEIPDIKTQAFPLPLLHTLTHNPSVSAPTLAHVDSLLLGIIEYNFIPLPQDLMTRKGGLKEVMRGINGGIKRLIKLLTMKYYYHCFINSPKVHIPHKLPTLVYKNNYWSICLW